MAENYLITGFWGEPHVTAENYRGINAATFGAGRFVLDVGQKFNAEYIGNNTIRVYDGKLIDNGAIAGIPTGEYVDLKINETGAGMKRRDRIVFQYSKDESTLVETGSFVVVKGTETSGTASAPAATQNDLLTNPTAVFDQMPLWYVDVSGSTISAPVREYTLRDVRNHTHAADHITGGNISVARGGTGAGTAAAARANLGAAATTTYTVSVPKTWTDGGTSTGYYQTVTVSGMTADDNPIPSVVLGADIAANKAYMDAWACITRISTAANSITLWANKTAPESAFTLQLKVVR